MSYVMFSDDCYKFYNDNNIVPSFDDQSHRHLFDFVSMDLHQIEVLLEKFFSEMFDFTRLRLKENRPAKRFNDEYEKAKQSAGILNLTDYYVGNAYLKKIISILESSHPYYRIGENSRKATEDIVIDYFHLFSSYNEDFFEKSDDYIGVFKELLTVPPLLCGYFTSGRTEKLYKKYLDDYNSYRRIIRKNRKYEARCFINIVSFQQMMNELLFRILDTSTPVISRLNIYDRIWFYKRMQSKKTLSDAEIQKLSLASKKNSNLPKGKEFAKELYTFITQFPLHEAFQYDFTPACGITLIIPEDGNDVCEQLGAESLEKLLEWEFMKMVKAGVRIKKCENCGKYFFVRDNKNNYCDREFEEERTCLDVGSDRRFKNQKKDDVYYTAYRKACNKNTARLKSKTKAITEEGSLKNWRKEAKKRLNAVYSGTAEDKERFYDWLDLSNVEINDLC
ncbi:hypothetical protein SDC9_15110 [bioreactor metagenome]|uniref:Uncharacterized protein n=1 Tax=bioreactor metagenome TaxID=1076179 RepID=A0A644TR77_9ZZZZ|nr:DUF6076 domain-containing protein [Negativicutes bacterium]